MQPFLLTSVQFITYPVQTSDSSLFNRFLTPYNPSTYSPSIAFLFHTNARLTPPSIAFLLLTYSHSIAFLSTYNPPTYSPSITLLSTHKRPTYSPSIPFLLTYNCYLTLTNVRLTPLQMCYLPRTTVRLTHLQTPYLFHTNLCRNRLQLNAYSVRTSRLSLFKPGNASPFNATQRFRLIRIESVTYSHTTVELTPHRKVGLDHLQPNIYPHTKVALIHNSIPHLRAYKGGVYLPSVRCTAKMRYSGHHFSRLTRAGSLHSHPERPAYLMRESRKVAFKLNGEWNGVSPVLHGA